MVPSARLTLEEGVAQPESLALEPDKTISIGRHSASQIVLKDDHASRNHAEIYFHADCWYVRDIQALNRTQVNGKAILGPTPLANEARIQVGRTVWQFTLILPPSEDQPWQYLGGEEEKSGSFHLETIPLQDELPLLIHFSEHSANAKTRHALIQLALKELEACQPDARFGFMSLEADESQQIVVTLPHATGLKFSEQLTREVVKFRKPVWICEPGKERLIEQSLHFFSDALGLPLGVEDPPIGMLHIYRLRGRFSERTVRFCELLAGALSQRLHALRTVKRLFAENQRLRACLPKDGLLLGGSKVMTRLRQQVHRAAKRNSTVLICGESGVGKELVALELHRQGPRSAEPLVAVNAAAIPPLLVESQFFGHRRGAFSDAVANHRGFFEQADGGILFLDEVGELALEMQAKLLRVLEDQEFRPVGAASAIRTDVRVVAATNRDLQFEVDAGRFRADLFYRLEVITIPVPPLREHLDDIPQLVDHFLASSQENKGRNARIDSDALRKLQSFSWPGNVRQLRTAIERALASTDGAILGPENFQLSRTEVRPRFTDLNLERIIEAAIRQALEQTRGNKVQAAALLDISRDTLANRMKKYGMSRDED